jgi:hypothetical protein
MKECDKDFIVKIQSMVNEFDAEIKVACSDYDDVRKREIAQESPVIEEQKAGKIPAKIQQENKK